jgi:hypothetical protein
VNPSLGPPGDLADAGVLTLLTTTQCGADYRLAGVVVGGLDEQAAGML